MPAGVEELLCVALGVGCFDRVASRGCIAVGGLGFVGEWEGGRYEMLVLWARLRAFT